MRVVMIAGMPLFLALAACGAAEEAFNEVGKGVEAEQAAAAQRAAYSPAQAAYAAANDRMHAGMSDIPADADVAFMQGMIPHHQGAIDMARVVLEHGDDEATKALARRVIAAQEGEIAEMQAWLTKNGAAAPAATADPAAPVDHSAMGH
jgi:uncharacterized protein (DUF305 family)